jgi:gas vesicle protein
MENAIFGFMGALIGAGLGFIGSLLSTFGKSKDTSKDVLTRTVTNERAQWRKELREIAGEFVENALRIAANDSTGSIYALEKQRVLIKLRLNPNPEHALDASILLNIQNVLQYAKARNSEKLAEALSDFERDVQALLKQEWDKSKNEAESGTLHSGTANCKH